MEALKPCPFCGSLDLSVAGIPGNWWIRREGCGALGPSEETVQEMKALWNARAVKPLA